MGSIELESTAGGLVVAPSQATGGHLTQSDWGSQYRVQPGATLHILSILLESALAWAGLPEGIDQ